MPATEVESSNDVELLRLMATGDEAAFSTFFDRFNRVLFSFVVRVVRSEAEAEDVLQEAFWQIWTKASTYRSDLGTPFSWAVTLARRKAIDRLRSTSRHLHHVEAIQSGHNDEETAINDGGEQVDAETTANAVRHALAQLPREQLQAIEFAFFEGLTHAEISQKLDVPIGTVKARIRRGMEKLRAPLSRLRLTSGVFST